MHSISRMRNEEGFTLIELMIVMIVLGILAGIVLFAVGTFQSDAESSSCEADQRNLATAKAAYKARNDGDDPSGFDDLVPEYIASNPKYVTFAGACTTP